MSGTPAKEKPINVALPITTLRDARERARALVPELAWDWLECGTEREWSLAANEEAFRKVQLAPRIFRDVSTLVTERTLLGLELPLPVVAAPLGGMTQYHLDGEAGIAAGCAARGIPMTVSAMTRLRLEDIRAGAPDATLAYQIYFHGPEDWLEEQLRVAEQAGVSAICLCGDAPVRSMRYRDRENRYDARRFGRRTSVPPPNHAMGASATFDQVAWFRQRTSVPLIVKGVMCGADARLALEHGADAVWVSNHGGRVLDAGPATLEVLPEVREAVGDGVPLLFDGGVRTGTDVLKALSLGADVVAIGRPIAYGLAVDGAAGVGRVLELFEEELRSAMGLCGIAHVDEASPEYLRAPATGEQMLAVARRGRG